MHGMFVFNLKFLHFIAFCSRSIRKISISIIRSKLYYIICPDMLLFAQVSLRRRSHSQFTGGKMTCIKHEHQHLATMRTARAASTLRLELVTKQCAVAGAWHEPWPHHPPLPAPPPVNTIHSLHQQPSQHLIVILKGDQE